MRPPDAALAAVRSILLGQSVQGPKPYAPRLRSRHSAGVWRRHVWPLTRKTSAHLYRIVKLRIDAKRAEAGDVSGMGVGRRQMPWWSSLEDQASGCEPGCIKICAQLHHCCSQGVPSLSPSIIVPGQLSRKNFASSHDVICEQRVLPSQRYFELGLPCVSFCIGRNAVASCRIPSKYLPYS